VECVGGCAILAFVDTGEVYAACESDIANIMKMKTIESADLRSADSKAELCCKDMRRAGLAELINDAHPYTVTVPAERQDEIVNDCGQSLTLAEHIERHGLVVADD
jgi:hypothetical protein